LFLLLFAGNIVDLLVILSNLSILGRYLPLYGIHSFTDSENQPESSPIISEALQ